MWELNRNSEKRPEPFDFEQFKILPKMFPGLRREEIKDKNRPLTEQEQENLAKQICGWIEYEKRRKAK